MIALTDMQKSVMSAEGHTLVTGGPGSGKTTISILKAASIADHLQPGQRVLFLSFARATVSRVMEAIDESGRIPHDTKQRLDVDTYHAFFWRLIRSHGYLLGLPRHPRVLATPGESVALADIRREFTGKAMREREQAERLRLARKEGLVCFDLFGKIAGRLLYSSCKIRHLVSNAYPTVLLDEFQDTSDDQWVVIQALGRDCNLIALADPDQRIFSFIGAHPKRLQHFEDEFAPSKIDLGSDNHRSPGTDIMQFANNILTGEPFASTYNDVGINRFPPNRNQAFVRLYYETLNAIRRLRRRKGPRKWSLAILVPTKKMTRMVSDSFRWPVGNRLPIKHYAVVDVEAAVLGAEIIAYVLQQAEDQSDTAEFVALVCAYYRGKGGESPTQKQLQEAERIERAYNKAVFRRNEGKEPAKNSLFLPMERAWLSRPRQPTGDPVADWIAIRSHFAESDCKRLKEIAGDVRNVRLLGRGTQLRQELGQAWRDTGKYTDALEILRRALVREHFATSKRPESGVVVMNMHKAKGKQFDEVIIFEGWPLRRGSYVTNQHRIVPGNSWNNLDDGVRQNLRVSVSRARRRTTIFTPKSDPCIILPLSTQGQGSI